MEKRIEPRNYRTGLKGAMRALRVMTKRWGWVEVSRDCLGWTLVKPYQMEPEHQALLDSFSEQRVQSSQV